MNTGEGCFSNWTKIGFKERMAIGETIERYIQNVFEKCMSQPPFSFDKLRMVSESNHWPKRDDSSFCKGRGEGI
jgi:hypothetical protein